MARPTDYNLDPPDEPETTLEQDLIALVDRLLEYRRSVTPLTFQLEKFYNFLDMLDTTRDEMRADELPDYDTPATTSTSNGVNEWLNLNAGKHEGTIVFTGITEREQMEEDESNG